MSIPSKGSVSIPAVLTSASEMRHVCAAYSANWRMYILPPKHIPAGSLFCQRSDSLFSRTAKSLICSPLGKAGIFVRQSFVVRRPPPIQLQGGQLTDLRVQPGFLIGRFLEGITLKHINEILGEKVINLCFLLS